MYLKFETVELWEHADFVGLYGQVAKFQADGDQKSYAQQQLQLQSFPTILFFPKNSTQIIKYPSENREVDALIGFVEALQ